MTGTAVHPATEAALDLAAEDHHVHLISSDDVQCLTGDCSNVPGA